MMNLSFVGRGVESANPEEPTEGRGRARAILEFIRKQLDAEGLVFWRLEGPRLEPGEIPEKITENHLLVTGVSMFRPLGADDEPPKEGHLKMQGLKLRETNSGSCFLKNKFIDGLAKNVEGPEEYKLDYPFLSNQCFEEREVKWIAAHPIRCEDSKVYGVLAAYWSKNTPPITEKQKEFFALAAAMWPGLYQHIRSSRRLQLITAVDGILTKPPRTNGPTTRPAHDPIPPEEAEHVLEQVCHEIGELLHAAEVSIFLSPLRVKPIKWSCRASSHDPAPRRTFDSDRLEGITGWCLRQREPLYVPNLFKFEENREWLATVNHESIRDAEWLDDLKKREASGGAQDYVLSFLATPIVIDDDVLGIIRCTSEKESPLLYFSAEELDALSVIAQRIGQIWKDWQIAHVKTEEALAWTQFNETLVAVSALFEEAIERDDPDNEAIFAAILEGCEASLAPWGICTRIDPPTKKSSRNGDVPIPVIKFAFHENLPGIHHSKHAQDLVDLANRQIMVHLKALELVQKVNRGNRALGRALSDLRHQIKNPLNKGLLRINKFLRTYGNYEHVANASYPIRGLLRKSINVADCFNLLVELETDGRFRLDPADFSPQKMYILSTEAIRDAREDLNRERNITIEFTENLKISGSGKDAKYHPTIADLQVDQKLVEQVLNSLLENAEKYSYSNSTIEMEVLCDETSLQIEVRNRGTVLTEAEAARATERGWRSKDAEIYSSDGTGIGLYLVKTIAMAHGGEFEILPTQNKITRARFEIPRHNQIDENIPS